MGARPASRTPIRRRLLVAGVVTLTAASPSFAVAQEFPDTDDPRANLAGGIADAETAAHNTHLLAHVQHGVAGDTAMANTDIAFVDGHAIVGSFNGFAIYDISDPAQPTLRTEVICPGGQGDVSVHGNLLFVSVEQMRSKIDCSATPEATPLTRFRGIRIFDITDLDNPVQVGGVQTCRGSHTHTLVPDLDDASHVYIYNSGTTSVRSSTELAGCSTGGPNPSQWLVEVIEVPLADPGAAAIVHHARLFIDPNTGSFSAFPNTNHCHDITVYPEIGLAAGACAGRGLLIDISDPAHPTRIDAVGDPLFAYWHSATFNNDGTKVVFTDEVGGGVSARCRQTDALNRGADGIYDIVQTQNGPRLQFASYFKIPTSQTTVENCVAHNGSLVPVPGRDIMVQAWYQGGLSIFDFTDSSNPVEIGYFDRGPLRSTLTLGGLWSAYWYDGHVYGSEIARGFDVYRLISSEHLSANEIAAARSVTPRSPVNVQHQQRVSWPITFALAGAYLDQAERDPLIDIDADAIGGTIATAEAIAGSDPSHPAVASLLLSASRAAQDVGAVALHQTLADLAEGFLAPPGIPTAVTATVSDGTATLSWAPPEHDGGDPVAGYRVEIAASGLRSTVDVDASVTTHQFTGLTNGTAYALRVAAVNGHGVGEFSSPVTTTPGVDGEDQDSDAGDPDPSDADDPAAAFVAITPTRILDSRIPAGGGNADLAEAFVPDGHAVPAGTSVKIPVPAELPPDAAAAVVTLTSAAAVDDGYFTAHACGQQVPLASNTNPTVSHPIGNTTVAEIVDGHICVYTSAPTHMIVDVNAYVPSGAGFTSVTPTRLHDTRDGGGPPPAGSTLRISPPTTTGSSLLTVTSAGTQSEGFATVYPCVRPFPPVSNLNPTPGHPTANLVLVPNDAGDWCVFVSSATHVVVDHIGTLTGPTVAVNARVYDSRTAGLPLAPGATAEFELPGEGMHLVNVTTTLSPADGFVTVHRCASPRPLASNLNPAPGHAVANTVIVPGRERICVYTLDETHLVIDHLASIPEAALP